MVHSVKRHSISLRFIRGLRNFVEDRLNTGNVFYSKKPQRSTFTQCRAYRGFTWLQTTRTSIQRLRCLSLLQCRGTLRNVEIYFGDFWPLCGTLEQIRTAIPDELFVRNTLRGVIYLARYSCLAAAAWSLASRIDP